MQTQESSGSVRREGGFNLSKARLGIVIYRTSIYGKTFTNSDYMKLNYHIEKIAPMTKDFHSSRGGTNLNHFIF